MNTQAHVSHLSSYERGAVARPPFQPFRPTQGGTAAAAPKKFVAKGHDAQLQDAQYNNLPVEVVTLLESVIKGVIVRRDKYTVTLRLSAGTDAGKDLMIYKHAIESILIERTAPATPVEA